MEVDFDILRESIRISFNDLCAVASDAKFRYDEEFLLVDPHGLQNAIEDLRNNIVTLLSVTNPESGRFIEGDIESFDLDFVTHWDHLPEVPILTESFKHPANWRLNERPDKEKMRELAMKEWENDQKTNPNPVNPEAYSYGFIAALRFIGIRLGCR